MKTIKELINIVETNISKQDFVHEPKELYEPIKYGLSSGGKRLRPVLTLIGCEMFDGKIEDAIMPALGIEIFHNFTLVHDDIMDNAPLRRGRETVYKKWNSNIAILSGDAMMIKAYQYISKCKSSQLPKILETFNDIALKVCEGQQYDMNFENTDNVTIEQYNKMIELKTSVLLAGSLKIGGIIAGANEKNLHNLYESGKYMGLAFQVQDDLLDVFAEQDKFGKKVGGDIVCNKKTWLLIKALEVADKKDKKIINEWLNKKTFIEEEKIEAITNIYNKYNIKQLAIEQIKTFFNESKKHFELISVADKMKENLIIFMNMLMKRDY